MSRKKSKRNALKQNISLHLYTIITIILFFITVATITNVIHNFNNSNLKSDFTLIESGDYKFKMYQYSYPREKFTTILVDESIKSFDVDLLNIKYDEKLYFHSKRELEDFYYFTKTDRTKLYVLIDSEHTDLQNKIESFHAFDTLLDVKDKTQIFHCGNKKSDKTLVFVDSSLNISPKNISYWNLGIDPENLNIIRNYQKFYMDYCKNMVSGGTFDLFNYNIYVIVSNKNKELLKICKLLK